MTMHQEKTASKEKLAEQVERLIEFQENQIVPGSNEEDVEMRERAIIRIQHEFSAMRTKYRSFNGQGN